MKYDLSELSRRVRDSRRGFIVRLALALAFMVIAFVLILFGINDTLSFVLTAFEFCACFFIYSVFCKFTPFVLFGSEIIGENVRENEYVGRRKVNYHGRYKPRGTHIRLLNTGANRRGRNDSVIRSGVYIRCENGNVVYINDLYKSSTDIYEIGDTLIKYAGTKYPIVLGRYAQRQPCPLCGEVNSEKDSACRSCALKITVD